MVVTGRDKETGENISFLSHQDPSYFLKNEKNKNLFKNDLNQRFMEIKERCLEGTVDAVIFGGRYINWWNEKEDYLESVKLLNTEVRRIFGFEPLAITGPKIVNPGKDNVVYDNGRRRLYIIRPGTGDASTESYSPRDIMKQKEKWK